MYEKERGKWGRERESGAHRHFGKNLGFRGRLHPWPTMGLSGACSVNDYAFVLVQWVSAAVRVLVVNVCWTEVPEARARAGVRTRNLEDFHVLSKPLTVVADAPLYHFEEIHPETRVDVRWVCLRGRRLFATDPPQHGSCAYRVARPFAPPRDLHRLNQLFTTHPYTLLCAYARPRILGRVSWHSRSRSRTHARANDGHD